jgi:hypothetical protein
MQNQDVVQLQVGYHVLEGKRMPLKKPMAIMDKVQETDSEGNIQTVCKVCGAAGAATERQTVATCMQGQALGAGGGMRIATLLKLTCSHAKHEVQQHTVTRNSSSISVLRVTTCARLCF